ncbi:MAG TPA: sugar phosphate isomerase/epimerase family protein [Bryobacteraceae bacterium]
MTSHLLTRRRAFRLLASSAALLRANAAERHMFLSLNSVLVSNRVPWPEFAHLAAQVGFPGTDVMLKPAMQAGAATTNDLLSQLKLLPAVIDFPVEFRKDDATFRKSLSKLPAAAQFAAAIHCPRMITWIMSSSDTPKEELRRTYKQRFTESARILEQSNVRLGLEFLGPLHIRKQFRYEFIWRMNDMLEFAEECGPNVGLLLDAWHWHHAGATTQDIVNAGRKRIVHIHFDDAPDLPPEKIRDDERLLPGEGVINLTGFLRALQTIGYTDALSVEIFGRGLNKMPPQKAAKLGLDSSLAVFRKAGVPQG